MLLNMDKTRTGDTDVINTEAVVLLVANVALKHVVVVYILSISEDLLFRLLYHPG